MKKITFILFALFTGTTFAQEATADAAADIVSPISISAEQALNFGKVSNITAGTVVIEANGNIGAGSLTQIGTTAPSAASFDVIAASGFSYGITLPTADVILKSGTDEITVNNFIDNLDESITGSGSAQTFGVGATLNVATSQPTGNYTGTFNVSVAYE